MTALAACMQADSRDILEDTMTMRLSCSIEAKITIMFCASTALKYSVKFLCCVLGIKMSFNEKPKLNEKSTYIFWNTGQSICVWRFTSINSMSPSIRNMQSRAGAWDISLIKTL